MPPQFKLASFIIMWVIVGIILLTMIATGFLTTGGLGAWILAFIVAAGAASASSNLFEAEKGKSDWQEWPHSAKNAKAKRGDDDFISKFMSLLDEDDARELRQRIKQHLAEHIDSADEEEAESFEQLLSSRDRQKRK